MICERCKNDRMLYQFGKISLCIGCWQELGEQWKRKNDLDKRLAQNDLTEEEKKSNLETNLLMLEIDKFVGRVK